MAVLIASEERYPALEPIVGARKVQGIIRFEEFKLTNNSSNRTRVNSPIAL